VKLHIPQTNIKIVLTTEAALNDLVNKLIADKRQAILEEGYLKGRSDLAIEVKAHFAGVDLDSNVRRVPVLDLPPYQDQPIVCRPDDIVITEESIRRAKRFAERQESEDKPRHVGAYAGVPTSLSIPEITPDDICEILKGKRKEEKENKAAQGQ